MTVLDPTLRSIFHTSDADFRPYDRYGFARNDMEWIPLSGEIGSAFESFVLRMKPGTRSTPHEHTGGEEFLMLEGELVDCDGVVFGPGDYVVFEPGSMHYSESPGGCTVLVILRGHNRPLDAVECDEVPA